jgi:molybdopterin/thiamine biosynthesis adenylyltransferase
MTDTPAVAPRALVERGLADAVHFHAEAFNRNVGFLSPAELTRLARSRVAIPGLGGVGGVHLITLARAGVGRFHLADMDTFEPANFNRQYGARVSSLGRPKVDVMAEEVRGVNPFVDLRLFADGVTDANLDDFLTDVDVVVDGMDFFNFRVRRRIFNRALARGIPVVTAGPIGFGTPYVVFTPEGMGFDAYFDVNDATSDLECSIAFLLGIAPRLLHLPYTENSRLRLERRAGPSLGLACQLAAGVASTEAIRLLLGRPDVLAAPHHFHFDAYRRRYVVGRLRWGNRGPLQRLKRALLRRALERKAAAFRSPPRPPSVPAGALNDSVIDYLLEAGTQAPSGDNAQPWILERTANGVHLGIDRPRDQSFFNFRQYASLLSCGAFLENVSVTARALGLRMDVTDLPAGEEGDRAATMIFHPDIPERSPLVEAVWNRETNRQMYRRTPLPPESREALERAVQGDGARLFLRTSPDDLRRLARAAALADRLRSSLRGVHEHLHHMIRDTIEDARATGDGFSYGNLCVNPGEEAFLKFTRPWRIMSALLRFGFDRVIADNARKHTVASSAVGMITMPGATARDFLLGGRALQRVWLTACAEGLAFQPMAALNFFWTRWHQEGEASFPEDLRPLLREAFPLWQSVFPDVDFSKEGIILLFRIGVGAPPPEGTFRRPLKDFFQV